MDNLWQKPAQSRQTKKILSTTHVHTRPERRGAACPTAPIMVPEDEAGSTKATDRPTAIYHLPHSSPPSLPSSLHHHLTANNGCCAHARASVGRTECEGRPEKGERRSTTAEAAARLLCGFGLLTPLPLMGKLLGGYCERARGASRKRE